ncbi:YbfB/YjiJ family MFS transporter [Anaeromyxobacter oryzae]|uniref:MFS transporter n=1 Tax=Anaeromyxobacter oryzae TaxID=2918170 RepID=A0ABM7X0H2_9BACT|nr:YbfB/YjiJ family MFS transporter [Anaeromyxobacter oryzae]BDG05217.1 MFS transporter [Anaeromyxobacter oryzae]
MARSPHAPAVDGALALAAAMGIGRFAYTALLPATQRALGIDDAVAGALASGNLVGYLAGVLVARQLVAGRARGAALRAALAATALATALGAALPSTSAWAVLRFVAGVASGLVFVLASAAALERAAARAGVIFGGVGIGIALSGAVAALSPAWAGFEAPWLVLAAAAALLAIPGWRHLAVPVPAHAAAGGAGPPPHPGLGLGRLGAAYFLEGLGYIVSGTFTVAAVRRTPGLEPLAPWTWVLTGVAAVPSAILWARAGRRIGARRALSAAYLVQAAGMALPSLSRSPGAALAGAALFGGTFMGITTLAMAAGRSLAPATPGRIVATLTAVYGVGQILGPILAGALSHRLGDPRPAVLAAAAAVAAGGALLAVPGGRERSAGARDG